MSAILNTSASFSPVVKQEVHWTDRLGHIVLLVIAVALLAFLAAPLVAILMQSVESKDGAFVGLDNFISYVQTPTLKQSLWNSLWVSTAVTLIAVPAAFLFAYALTRSCMPFKGLFRAITLTPLLAPSMLSAISFIYWFGNQGVRKYAENF